MLRAAVVVALTLLGSMPAVEPLVSGRVRPETYDFGAFVGPQNAEARIAAEKAILARHGQSTEGDLSNTPLKGCMAISEAMTWSGLKAAGRLKKATDWADVRRQADAALERRASLKRHLFAGGASPFPQLKHIEANLKSAREAKSPRLAMLFRLAAEDQFARHGFAYTAQRTWAAGLSEAAYDLTDGAASIETCNVDARSRAWLAGEVRDNGWFRNSVDGPGATHTAWLLVQHADRDPALQKAVLEKMAPLAAAGEVEPMDYAYLVDRLAVNERRAQTYGTQGRCEAAGIWVPMLIEDEANVQARRDAYRLGSLDEYRAIMSPRCREAG